MYSKKLVALIGIAAVCGAGLARAQTSVFPSSSDAQSWEEVEEVAPGFDYVDGNREGCERIVSKNQPVPAQCGKVVLEAGKWLVKEAAKAAVVEAAIEGAKVVAKGAADWVRERAQAKEGGDHQLAEHAGNVAVAKQQDPLEVSDQELDY